jgi:hypothetical protein
MAFYEVYREDENGYASAVVRAHGTRQAVNALTHLGFTLDNSIVERIPDGRSEPVKILATVEESRAVTSPEQSTQGEATGGLYDYIG